MRISPSRRDEPTNFLLPATQPNRYDILRSGLVYPQNIFLISFFFSLLHPSSPSGILNIPEPAVATFLVILFYFNLFYSIRFHKG